MSSVDVLIVGGGPTGLALACELVRQGVTSIMIVDRLSEQSKQSKASVVHARTLELLCAYDGVVDSILSRSVIIGKAKIMSNPDTVITQLSLDQGIDSKFNFMTAAEQWHTENCLHDYLKRNGISISWGHQVVAVTETTELASGDISHSVTIERMNEPLEEDRKLEVQARFIVGADGAKSFVRNKICKIDFKGIILPYAFCALHFRTSSKSKFLDPNAAIFSFYKQGMAFVTYMPDDTWLMACDLTPEQEAPYLSATEKDHHGLPLQLKLTFEQSRQLVKERLSADVEISEIIWESRFRVNERLAVSYGNGHNIFLAGDSVHCHTPLWGQGMNTGIQDAINLGWKLAMVINNHTTKELLQTYEAERWPIGQDLISLTTVGQKSAGTRDPSLQFLRHTILNYIPASTLSRIVGRQISEICNNYRNSPLSCEHWHKISFFYFLRRRANHLLNLFGRRIKAGDRWKPDAVGSIDDIFLEKTPRFKVVIFQGVPWKSDPRFQLLPEQIMTFIEELKEASDGLITAITVVPTSDLDAHLKIGVLAQCLFLIRPDGYVGLRCQPLEVAMVQGYLKNCIKAQNIKMQRDEKFKPIRIDWVVLLLFLGVVAATLAIGTQLLKSLLFKEPSGLIIQTIKH